MPDRSARGRAAHAKGLDAEATAARLAVSRGHTVLETRHRTPHGEIDLIVRDGAALVFVEVKARPTRDEAALSITPRQWQRLASAALHYAAVYRTRNISPDAGLQNADPDMRFDVVLVDAAGRATWMENARRFDDW